MLADSNSGLLGKIKQELENPDSEKSLSRSDRKTGVIKYIGLLAEMINILVWDVKVKQEKLTQLEATETQVQKLNQTIEQLRTDYEQERNEILNSKNEEFELKNQEINDLSNDYQKQIAIIKGNLEEKKIECKDKEVRIETLTSDITVLTNNMQTQIESTQNLKQLCSSLALRTQDLIFQKQLLQMQYKNLNQAHAKTCGFMERVYYKVREINLDSGTNETSFVNETSLNVQTQVEYSPRFIFRKCVLTVIAIHRMRLLALSDNDGFGKHHIDDIEGLEISELPSGHGKAIYINTSYQNPYYWDTDEQLKSFSKLQNSLEGSISVTPIKGDPNENIAKELFHRRNTLSTSKSCYSIHPAKNASNSKFKRRMRDLDPFPYINFGFSTSKAKMNRHKSVERFGTNSGSKGKFVVL